MARYQIYINIKSFLISLQGCFYKWYLFSARSLENTAALKISSPIDVSVEMCSGLQVVAASTTCRDKLNDSTVSYFILLNHSYCSVILLIAHICLKLVIYENYYILFWIFFCWIFSFYSYRQHETRSKYLKTKKIDNEKWPQETVVIRCKSFVKDTMEVVNLWESLGQNIS